MRRLLGWSVLLPAALSVAGCAPIHAGSYIERSMDFAQYRTYDWGPADALPTGDPRLDQNPFFQDHVQGAIERGLAGKRLGRSTAGETPDLLIHYHASVNQQIDLSRLEHGGYCYTEDCQVRVVEFEAGTLVVDVLDARTGRLIWRGWAKHRVADILNNPDRMATRINQAVAGMLTTLPYGAHVTAATVDQTGGQE
jgi:hypothetical protein